jgi:hypothetical protein
MSRGTFDEMVFCKGKKAKRRFLRSAIALFLALNHLLVAVGVPIPLPSERASREMYPCMNCSCGCRTAEQCWRQCCCYTMSQKLSWAKAHGVTPPAFVVEAAAREGAQPADTDDHKPCWSHCQKKAVAKPVSTTHDSRRTDFIVMIKALECGGHGTFALLAGLPATVPPTTAIVPAEIRVLGYVVDANTPLVSFSTDVPVPPPRG